MINTLITSSSIKATGMLWHKCEWFPYNTENWWLTVIEIWNKTENANVRWDFCCWLKYTVQSLILYNFDDFRDCLHTRCELLSVLPFPWSLPTHPCFLSVLAYPVTARDKRYMLNKRSMGHIPHLRNIF